LLVSLCVAGCSVAPDSKAVFREERAGHRVLVELEPVETLETDTFAPFAHPLVVDEHELAEAVDHLLAEVAYGRPKGKKLVRLMAVEDRQRLASGLARGLVSAGSHERVLFVLRIDDRGEVPWFTPDSRLTRGVAFVDLEGRFHLAFDLIDDRIEHNDPDPYDPTERAQTRARIVVETGEDMGPADDGARRLWVAWPPLAWTAPDKVTPSEEPPITSAEPPSVSAGKLELLDELLRDDIIDREQYERRRARLSAEQASEVAPD
jgi:hypothetical protein